MMIGTDEKAHHAFFFFFPLTLPAGFHQSDRCLWREAEAPCAFSHARYRYQYARVLPSSMCRSVLISPMMWEIFSWSVNNAVLVSTQPDQIILTIMPNKWQREKEGLEGDGWPRVTGSSHAASAGKLLVCVLQKFLECNSSLFNIFFCLSSIVGLSLADRPGLCKSNRAPSLSLNPLLQQSGGAKLFGSSQAAKLSLTVTPQKWSLHFLRYPSWITKASIHGLLVHPPLSLADSHFFPLCFVSPLLLN